MYSILLLPRAPEIGNMLAHVPVAHLATSGPVQFDTHYRGRNGLYPVPDECLNAHTEGGASPNEVHLAGSYREGSKMAHLHDALAHTSDVTIMLMLKHDGEPLPQEVVSRADIARWCAACGVGKAHSAPYKDTKEHLDVGILAYVAADVKTSKGTSVSGFEAYLCIYERTSHKKFVYLLHNRAEASSYLLWWMERAHTLHHPHRIRCLHMDAGELRTSEVKAACKATGTVIKVNLRSEHKQNPEAEVQIKLIDQAERSARARGNAPDEWWQFSLVAVTAAMGAIPRQKALRKTRKQNGSATDRPLTPDEVCHKVRYKNYSVQFAKFIPPFCLCIGYVNRENRPARADPGFEAIYLCPLAESLVQRRGTTVREGCVETQRGHLVFLIKDGAYVPVRTVYPNVSCFPMAEGWGKLAHLGWHKNRHPLVGDMPAAVEQSVIDAVRTFPPGSDVMTHWGRATVHRVYPSGDLELSWPDGPEPENRYSMAPHEVWHRPPTDAPRNRDTDEVVTAALPDPQPQREQNFPVTEVAATRQGGGGTRIALPNTPASTTLVPVSSSPSSSPPAMRVSDNSDMPPLSPAVRSERHLPPDPVSPRVADGDPMHTDIGRPMTRLQLTRLLSGETNPPSTTGAAVILPQEPHTGSPECEAMNMDELARDACIALPHEASDDPTPFGTYNLCAPLMGEAHLTQVQSDTPKHSRSRYEHVTDPFSLIGKVPASEVELDLPRARLPPNGALPPLQAMLERDAQRATRALEPRLFRFPLPQALRSQSHWPPMGLQGQAS